MSKARDIADLKSGVDIDGTITSTGTISGDNLSVGGSAILDGSKNLKNIASIDATTDAAIASAGFTKTTGDITNVSTGGGLTGGGASGDVTVSHADTSAQASVNNSGSTFIQDITLDTYGHITNINSATVSTGAGTVKAWVNFNGSGTVAIRSSGNVSSITDNGSADYTVNFSSSMANSNYSTNITTSINGTGRISSGQLIEGYQYNASGVRVYSKWEAGGSGGSYDSQRMLVSVVQ